MRVLQFFGRNFPTIEANRSMCNLVKFILCALSIGDLVCCKICPGGLGHVTGQCRQQLSGTLSKTLLLL